MDLKLIDFEKRVPEKYRSLVLQESIKAVNEGKWEILGGRPSQWMTLTFSDKGKVRITIVKNKKSYTIYARIE